MRNDNIKIERLSLTINNLPNNFKSFKIAHISDIHSKDYGEKEKKALEYLKQEKPDYIFITGDIVDWTTKNITACQGFWQDLAKAFPGKVFAVWGNHDHRNTRFKSIEGAVKESGIQVLENEARKIEINGEFIYLIGSDDPHENYDNIEKIADTLKGNSVKILIAHSPEIFRKIKDKDIDLTLVGHTHGGQVDIPYLVDLVLPLKYDKKYKKGLFQEGSSYMYVNRGVGETFLPLRFNAPPEIAFITLQ